jgi:acyl carrier protein
MEESTLFKIIEEATGSDAGSVSLETTSADIEGWDSLGHLSIISAITDHLGAEVEEDPRLASADSVKELVEILQ